MLFLQSQQSQLVRVYANLSISIWVFHRTYTQTTILAAIHLDGKVDGRFPLIQFLFIDDKESDNWKPVQPSLDRLTSYVCRGLAYQRKRAVYTAMHPLLIRHAPIGRLDADTLDLIISEMHVIGGMLAFALENNHILVLSLQACNTFMDKVGCELLF
jgi:hypothetical protein